MSPSELKANVKATGSHFFSHRTMKFFGDTMKNFGVRSTTIINQYNNESVEVWELWRKRSVKHGLSSSHFFDKNTFEEIFKKD